MRSRTSLFNGKLFIKNLTRFWPVWASYLVILTLAHTMTVANKISYEQITDARHITYDMLYGADTFGLIFTAIFALISALAVFSYLYNHKSAGFIANLPMRRECAFVTNYLSGLFWMIASNVIVFLSVLCIGGANGIVDAAGLLQWLAVSSMQCMFFYSFAALCAMLTGHIVVLPLVYAVLNFTAVAVEAIVRAVLNTFVYGMSSSTSVTSTWLSPIVKLFNPMGVYIADATTGEIISRGYYGYWFEGSTNIVVKYGNYTPLAIYSAVGAVFVICALLLYRRRHMETAGDIVAVKPLRPVFKYSMTFGCALVLGYIFNDIILDLGNSALKMGICMVIGGFIGYFASEMLMKKAFKVFGNWKGFAVSALIIVALVAAMNYDLFGYEKYVPARSKVESVYLSTGGNYINLDEGENIDAVIALHKSILDHKDIHDSDNYKSGWSYSWVRIRYTLTSGKLVERQYSVATDAQNVPEAGYDAVKIAELVNSTEAIRERYDLDKDNYQIAGMTDIMWVGDGPDTDGASGEKLSQSIQLTPDEFKELYKHLEKDMENGDIGKVWVSGYDTYEAEHYTCLIKVLIQRYPEEGDSWHEEKRFIVNKDSVNTLAFLDELGVNGFMTVREYYGQAGDMEYKEFGESFYY